MHLQPLFAACQRYGGSVAEDLFRRGICLPSSSSLTVEDQLYVINRIRHVAGAFTINTVPDANFHGSVPASTTPLFVS